MSREPEDSKDTFDEAFDRLYKKIDAMPKGATLDQVIVFWTIIVCSILLGLAIII